MAQAIENLIFTAHSHINQSSRIATLWGAVHIATLLYVAGMRSNRMNTTATTKNSWNKWRSPKRNVQSITMIGGHKFNELFCFFYKKKRRKNTLARPFALRCMLCFICRLRFLLHTWHCMHGMHNRKKQYTTKTHSLTDYICRSLSVCLFFPVTCNDINFTRKQETCMLAA